MMTELEKLPPRLAAIAALVPPGAALADVGTDHALLPIALLRAGRIRAAVATDINADPLARAKRNARGAGIDTAALRFALCDGLAAVSPEEADTVVIAGLGGENIAGVLARAPWTRRGVTLLLQPMTRAELLRRALIEQGFAVTAETLAEDSGRLYSILTARGGADEPYAPGEEYTGRERFLRGQALFLALLAEQIRRLEGAARGLERAADAQERERLAALNAALEGLHSIRRRSDAERTGDSGLL